MRTAAEARRRRLLASGLVGVVLAVCVAAMASGPAPRPVQAPPSGTPTLTLMTYNVNYGLAGDSGTLLAIREGKADLVLLQETTPAWEQSIRVFLSGEYPHMAFESPRNWIAGGMGVLSKKPLHLDAPVDSPVGWFFGWRIEADTALGRIQVLNVHLRPPLSDPSSLAKGYFSTRADRVREIELYLGTLRPGLPTYVVGDFNEGDDGAALRRALDRGMSNALQEFQPSATTWRWPVGPWMARTRLDHILYEPGSHTCFEARVLDAGRSDHLPVVATFGRR